MCFLVFFQGEEECVAEEDEAVGQAPKSVEVRKIRIGYCLWQL